MMKSGKEFGQLTMRFAALFLLLLLFSCGKKHAVSTDKAPRSFSVTLHPFWGGSAACELERKNGKDQLTYTYTVKKGNSDSSYSSAAEILKMTADSIFTLADSVNWLNTYTSGTAESKNQLTAVMIYKKGRIPKTLNFDRLKNVSELPADIRPILAILNRIAPDDFKLY